MVKKTDQRFSKADTAIRGAFLALLQANNFDKISVKMIIDQAGINRSTFYAHYLDKFDLMEKVQESLLNELIKDLPEINWTSQTPLESQFKQRSINIVNNITQHRELVSLMLSKNAGHSFESHLQNRSRQVFEDVITDEQLIIPREYASVLLTASVTSALTTWVKNGFEESPEDFADIISRVMPSIVLQLIKPA